MPSHLDYCNLLLSGIADTDLTQHRCFQNRITCVVTKSPPFTFSFSPLCSLHRLPVNFRIVFTICLLMYKTSSKTAFYLHSMLAPITSIPFTEIKRRNHSVGPKGKDQSRCKSISLLWHISLEQPPTVCLFSHFSCYLQETCEDPSL